MPAAVDRNAARSCARSRPERSSTPVSFSSSTGSTQGMTLRMSPPSSATASTGSIAIQDEIDAAATIATGRALVSIPRSPSNRVNVRSLSVTSAPLPSRSTGTNRRAA